MPHNVISKNEGVSPVIGTILLVALTVVLVGIIGAVLMGFGMPEPAPIVGISIGNQGNIITVTQLNGAVLPAGSYTILVDGVDKTAEFGGDVDFGPGITLSWDSGSEAVGTVSVVYTGTSGGETVLAQKTIDKAGSRAELGVLVLGGKKYTITSTWEQWSEYKANDDNQNKNIPMNLIFYQDGEYWYVVQPNYLSKINAENPDFTIQMFNALYPANGDVIVNIDQSNSNLFYESDTIPTADPNERDLDRQANVGALYIDSNNDVYIYSHLTDPISYFATYDIRPYGWYKIGTLSSP
ncbi:type IV pilin N-terminal domain-containing protein [Methanocorpusculum sp. GPch4]|uniref:type IV pilin N-terminal domain-containing protein n=1 Tax=Methanocorpusculum sp. GPch4 TaxID=2527877 RepID=UPI001432AB79|nr:type IV pilin N-terminal domain-containing protein [Methanocorpusculum sp. GPch4]